MKHEPLRPARASHIPEQVYASKWAALMAEDWGAEFIDGEAKPLEVILRPMFGPIEQRHATVAATFACWLGCNVGMSIHREAQAQVLAGRWARHVAYLLAWTLENRRRIAVNGGIRIVEYLLTPAEDRHTARDSLDSGLNKLPDLSSLDLEVIDHVCLWLATERGQRFIRTCEREIDRLQDEERRRRDAAWRSQMGEVDVD